MNATTEPTTPEPLSARLATMAEQLAPIVDSLRLTNYPDEAGDLGGLVAALQSASADAANLEGKNRALESLRPHWAQGWTDDSVAAQASAAALADLWRALGATNQTEAMERARLAPLPGAGELSRRSIEQRARTWADKGREPDRDTDQHGNAWAPMSERHGRT